MTANRMRFKLCPTCENPFSYEIGKGRDRKHCSDKCRTNHKVIRERFRYQQREVCKASGCDNKTRSKGADYCEMCYGRIRRTGNLNAPPPPRYRIETKDGYVLLQRPGHPIANHAGYIPEHRMLMYDRLGAGDHSCHWCGKVLEWKKICIDHIDNDRKNNNLTNLVVSCNHCNRIRGYISGFMKRIRPEVADEFLQSIKLRRKLTYG